MSDLVVRPAEGGLCGSVSVPSDKSISHRCLILAGLAEGRSELRRFSYGEDNVNTLRALRQLGVGVKDDGHGCVEVAGVGLAGLRAPSLPLDCGNSGTTMRMMSGVLVAQGFESVLVGDESLSSRPMLRVAQPLRQRGGRIEGRPHPKKPSDITAPLRVGPLSSHARLGAIEYRMSVASAQVKSALLLSGLFADGPTVVEEPFVSRDHTERLLQGLGVQLSRQGTQVRLAERPQRLPGFSVDLVGDLSAAAFPLVAAAIVAKSDVEVVDCGLNPTRSGVVDALRALGAPVRVSDAGAQLGEPVGRVGVSFSPLTGSVIAGELAVRSIDEIPILCVLAARASGTTTIRDVGELRVKESDRIGVMVSMLRGFGVECEESADGMVIEGQPEGRLRCATVMSRGDHRIAMSAAILGLVADGPSVIRDSDCIATSFPGFVSTMVALGASMEEGSA